MRQAVLYSALLITLGLSAWVSLTPAEEGEGAGVMAAENADRTPLPVAAEKVASQTPDSNPAHESAAPHTHDVLARRRGLVSVAQGEGAFGIRTWKATPEPSLPTPPIASAMNAVPSAPPLPFSFLGKLDVGDGRQRFYLLKGDTQFTISPGDVFDGIYQFEGVKDGHLVILYKPLSVPQTLPINR
jgi:hypothetical protein